MTPHELNLHIIEYGKRVEQEGKNNMVTAYLTAYYHRVKKMPDIKKLIKDGNNPKPKVKQTDEQMLAALTRMHAAMGGETK